MAPTPCSYVCTLDLSCLLSGGSSKYTFVTPAACVCLCVCVCVCACVCLGGEESERIWNKFEKGKGKEGERHLSASVMNSPLAFVHG